MNSSGKGKINMKIKNVTSGTGRHIFSNRGSGGFMDRDVKVNRSKEDFSYEGGFGSHLNSNLNSHSNLNNPLTMSRRGTSMMNNLNRNDNQNTNKFPHLNEFKHINLRKDVIKLYEKNYKKLKNDNLLVNSLSKSKRLYLLMK